MKFCTLCLRCYDDSVVSCTEESHPPLSETQLSSRTAIAGYRLEYLLESSLRSYVFRARQVVTDQTCLIKILETDDGGREEFLREARLAASVFHPSLMDVYEAGSLGSDRVYVVCEDVSGQTLRELLN